jgi:hypothetical protein
MNYTQVYDFVFIARMSGRLFFILLWVTLQLYDALRELLTNLNKYKMKNMEIWQEARKLKLGSKFLENIDTLLTSLENQNKQCIIQGVGNQRELLICPRCKSEHTYIKNDDFRKCYCPACTTSWANL